MNGYDSVNKDGYSGDIKENLDLSIPEEIEKNKLITKKGKYKSEADIKSLKVFYSSENIIEKQQDKKENKKYSLTKQEKALFKKDISGNIVRIKETKKTESESEPKGTVVENPIETENSIDKEIAEIKQHKDTEIGKQYPILRNVIRQARQICSSEAVLSALSEAKSYKFTMQVDELEIDAHIIHFPTTETSKSTLNVLVIDSSIDSKLGKGSYKTYKLGIDLHSGKIGGIGFQRKKPDSSRNRSPEEIRKEMLEEHEVGITLQNAVGSVIHCTTLVTVITEQAKKDQNIDGEEMDAACIERLTLWSPLLKGTFADFDPYHEGKKELIPLTPKELYKNAKVLFKALNKVHQLGFVHCDIRLDNFFLDLNLKPKLGDWGKAEKYEKMSPGVFKKKCRNDMKKLALQLGDLFSRIVERYNIPKEDYVEFENKFLELSRKYGVSLVKIDEKEFVRNDPNNPNDTPTCYWETERPKLEGVGQ